MAKSSTAFLTNKRTTDRPRPLPYLVPTLQALVTALRMFRPQR